MGSDYAGWCVGEGYGSGAVRHLGSDFTSEISKAQALNRHGVICYTTAYAPEDKRRQVFNKAAQVPVAWPNMIFLIQRLPTTVRMETRVRRPPLPPTVKEWVATNLSLLALNIFKDLSGGNNSTLSFMVEHQDFLVPVRSEFGGLLSFVGPSPDPHRERGFFPWNPATQSGLVFPHLNGDSQKRLTRRTELC